MEGDGVERKRGRVTLDEVARAAGVSKAVVSAVLSGANGTVRARPTTREQLLRAAGQLGYAPRYAARSLRRRRANRVTLVVHDLANPYYADIATAAAAAAAAGGIELHVLQAGEAEAERAAIENLRSGFSDGVIVATRRHVHDHAATAALRDLAQRGVPTVVLIDKSPHPAIPAVRIDDEAGAQAGVGHLLRLGHRRVGFLSGPMRAGAVAPSHMVDRFHGYRRALAEADLAFDAGLVMQGQITMAGGRDMVRRLLAEPARPSALFCFNDTIAVGALSALAEAGARAPDDVAVVGFDGLDVGEFTVPPLTTVAHSRDDLGRTAIETLLAQLGGRPVEAERLLETRLVVRRSCGAAVAGGRP
jgi:DNA-binding LacI/PurR family transcriptional regulator